MPVEQVASNTYTMRYFRNPARALQNIHRLLRRRFEASCTFIDVHKPRSSPLCWNHRTRAHERLFLANGKAIHVFTSSVSRVMCLELVDDARRGSYRHARTDLLATGRKQHHPGCARRLATEYSQTDSPGDETNYISSSQRIAILPIRGCINGEIGVRRQRYRRRAEARRVLRALIAPVRKRRA